MSDNLSVALCGDYVTETLNVIYILYIVMYKKWDSAIPHFICIS